MTNAKDGMSNKNIAAWNLAEAKKSAQASGQVDLEPHMQKELSCNLPRDDQSTCNKKGK
eukprot:CAMPEP_0169264148 /NCGR_PEP_ID=MMETSP1016-20121227/44874_1 /TAXON_ID=342587 /ORGANISM="Karlodinium micrum, Strain CCMP2283" /LENGTH=58 /DNA_ID=CAMNT_0009347297 /DNA_START=266 /DNA_END=442 /DNA_ORIENTATION=-